MMWRLPGRRRIIGRMGRIMVDRDDAVVRTVPLDFRLPVAMIDEVKPLAKKKGVSYARFIQEAIEQALAREGG